MNQLIDQQVMQVKGVNGKIELADDVVRITRDGALAAMSHLKGTSFSLDDVAAMEFHDASMLVNGFLRLLRHGQSPGIGRLAAIKDGNTVMFSYFHRRKFQGLRDELQHRLEAPGRVRRTHFSADEGHARAPASVAQPSEGRKAQNRAGLYAFTSSLVATGLIGYFVDPYVVRVFGVGIPWWGYLLFFVLLAGSVVQALAKQKAIENIAYGEVRTKVVNAPVGSFCSQCGTQTSSKDRFCPGCGLARP